MFFFKFFPCFFSNSGITLIVFLKSELSKLGSLLGASCNVHDVSVVLFGFCYCDLLMYAYVTTNKLVLE